MLVKADPKRSEFWDISEEAKKIKGVQMAHTVLGSFDAVLYVKFTDSIELKKIIDKVTSIRAVVHMQTLLALLPKKCMKL